MDTNHDISLNRFKQLYSLKDTGFHSQKEEGVFKPDFEFENFSIGKEEIKEEITKTIFKKEKIIILNFIMS